MKRVLGRKQSMKPEDEALWWRVIDNIENYVTKREVDDAAVEALDRIKTMTSGKNAAFAWSGGKDSLVIADLCKKLNITRCRCFYTDVEYPAWQKYLEENKPTCCEMIKIPIDLNYLAKHEKIVLNEVRINQVWNKRIRQEPLLKWLHNSDVNVILLGHRAIDGNVCGKGGIRQKAANKFLFSPIHDWSHELLFAYLHYNNIELPFIYRWYRGFYQGTHCWAERTTGTVEEGYREVFSIDSSIVYKAAEFLPTAKKFLEDLKWK